MLKVKLKNAIDGKDIRDYYEALLQWYAVLSVPNAWLFYELGRISFEMGYYDDSQMYFKELESGVGIGSTLRHIPRNPIIDKDGRSKRFDGIINKIFSSYEGKIRCESLRNLRYTIPFRPIAQKFTPSVGDMVEFSIAFNYRGPVAIEVFKI